MIKNNFKIAWRNLVKNPLYSLINIAGLAIGLALSILITLFVKDELSFDKFFKKKENIYRLVVEEKNPDGQVSKFGQTGMVHGPAFKQQISAFKNMVRSQEEHYSIKTDNEIEVQNVFLVDSTYFDMFEAEFVNGSPYKVLKDPQTVVVSEKIAKKYFNTTDAVGKSLNIEFEGEFQNFVVSGVIKNPPVNSSMQAEMLIPIHKSNNTDKEWINFYMNTFFELPAGTNIANIEKQFASIFASDAKDQLATAAKEWNYKSKLTFKLQPFLDIHLSKEFKASSGLKASGNLLFSYFLGGIALFILIIACINFVNLAIARSVQRSKEVGVRKSVGSTRVQLLLQFLSESFLLNSFAFILGIVLAYLCIPVFNELAEKQLALSYLFDWKLILTLLVLFIITGILAGFYPAIILSGFKPVETLYGRFHIGGKNILQKSLIVFQFSLATIFIVFAIVQYRQANLFVSKDLGYDDDNLIEVKTKNLSTSKIGVIENELKKDASILNVAATNQCCWYTPVTTNDGQEVAPYMKVTNANLLNTMGLNMKEGRFFSSEFPSDSTVSAVVNEAFVKATNMKNPLGQTIKVMNRDNYQIVGVIKDYHHSSLYETVTPEVFISNPKNGMSAFILRINNINISKTLAHIQSVFKSQFPTKPYKYEFISETNAKQYDREFKMRQMILYSAILIIFISCIGMFGLAALTAQKRTKEFGIRKVMGANISSIVQMMVIYFFKLVFIAFVLAVPIAYFAINAILQNLPYRVPVSLDIFIYTLLGVLFLSFITSVYQALKTAMMNPVKSLKSE